MSQKRESFIKRSTESRSPVPVSMEERAVGFSRLFGMMSFLRSAKTKTGEDASKEKMSLYIYFIRILEDIKIIDEVYNEP